MKNYSKQDTSLSEKGFVAKPWKNRVRIALVYPSSYETGMSSLGYQNLYRILNEKSFITAERVFLKNGESPRSVESSHGLGDFDFIFFSISYSADIINVFEMIRLSSISILSSNRSKSDPILCAGGTGIYSNPEPLASVMDFFFLGEAETFLEKFSSLLDRTSAAVKDSEVLFENIGSWEGIYIPARGDRGKTIKRVYEKDIGAFQTYSSLFSEKSQFGSMFMEEISRGCRRGCRFCSIGYSARPFRIRKPCRLAYGEKNREEKIGLVGAGICDHPDIREIAEHILNKGLSISFSSFRADRIDQAVTELIKSFKIKSFAIAPEAGSQRLRNIINKDLTDDQILKAAERLSGAGVKNLKLYFMIGLPMEEESDIYSIAELCKKIMKAFRGDRIKVSINPFIPKPFTPFQWFAMQSPKILKSKFRNIKSALRSGRISLDPMNLNQGLLDAFFSRADRQTGERIAKIFNESNYPVREVLNMAKDENCFIFRSLDTSKELPWDFIDMGVKRAHLKSEYDKAGKSARNP